MLPRKLSSGLRPIDEVTRLMEAYPPSWRRWCSGSESGGCACMGCVRQPAPSTVLGDPERAEWPNDADALNEREVEMYLATDAQPDR